MVKRRKLKGNPSGATELSNYEWYILEALCHFGGKAKTKYIYNHVFQERPLKDEDLRYRKSSNTEVIYKNNLQWAKDEFVKVGIIEPYVKGVNRGIWEFTEEGYRLYDAEIHEYKKNRLKER